MKCSSCGNPWHRSEGVYPRDMMGRKKVLARQATLMWCLTPDCPNHVVHNLCRNCGKWVACVDGNPVKCKCQTVQEKI